MSNAQSITSLQNPRVKNVVRLGNRRHRDRLQQTVVEGVQEAALALRKRVVPVEAFLCHQYITSSEGHDLANQLYQLAGEKQTSLFEVTPTVFDKMAYRAGSGGILLVISYLTPTLGDLTVEGAPLYAIVDGAEKPGNLGAILRTADAVGLDALLLTGTEGEGTDIHNPNTIRASLGAFFTVPVVTTTREEAMIWLRKNQIKTVATTPEAKEVFTAVSYTGPTAIIMGSEAAGLSRGWLDAADILVHIPMSGDVDSLNLSVATALMLYEALRQRTLIKSGSASPRNDA